VHSTPLLAHPGADYNSVHHPVLHPAGGGPGVPQAADSNMNPLGSTSQANLPATVLSPEAERPVANRARINRQAPFLTNILETVLENTK
jgi:hypothetical protein